MTHAILVATVSGDPRYRDPSSISAWNRSIVRRGRCVREHMGPVRPLSIQCFLVGYGHIAVRMHADTQQRISVGAESSFVEFDQRCETDRRAADDGQHQREAIAGGPHHRLWAGTHANPGWQMSLWKRRTEVLIGQRGAELARPGDGLVPHQAREQIELLLEELLVVSEVVSEKRERLDQRTAPDDELCPAVRHRVECGELGVYANGILRAEYGYRSAEPDVFGAAGDSGQDHVGR